MSAKFLRVADVASRLNVSKMTVYRLCENGTLGHTRVGRSFRIDPEAVERYLSANTIAPAHERPRVVIDTASIIIGPAWEAPEVAGREAIGVEEYPLTADGTVVVFVGSLDNLRDLGEGILSMIKDLSD